MTENTHLKELQKDLKKILDTIEQLCLERGKDTSKCFASLELMIVYEKQVYGGLNLTKEVV